MGSPGLVCVAAMALVVDALQLPGTCRSSISAAQRGAVGMALADGVLNVGAQRTHTMHAQCHAVCMRCPCDAHAMPMRCHAGVIGAGRIGLVHLEALSSCETYYAAEPGTSSGQGRPQAGLLLTRLSLALDRANPVIISNPTVSKAKAAADKYKLPKFSNDAMVCPLRSLLTLC